MQKLFVDIENLYTFTANSKSLLKIKDAALLVDASTILWVGRKAQALKKFKKAKRVSLKVKSLLPGFIDCHTHTVFAGDRQDEFELRNQGVSYQEIAKAGGGIRKTVEKTRKASAQKLLNLAEARCQQAIEQGVTTLEIKSGYGLSLKDELKILQVIHKIRTLRALPTFLGPHSIPDEYKDADSYLEDVISWLPKVSKLARRADIFIEKNYFSANQAEKYFKALQDLDFDIVAHCEQLSQSHGIDAALKFKALSVDHLVHTDERQIQALAKSDCVSVLLPASDFYLKINYPPARKILDAGGVVALATDFNPGSSPTQSLNFVGVLARLEMKMKLDEVLRAFTQSAAKALGMESLIGTLEVGKSADFVGFDCDLSELFYQVGFHPVRCVYLSGKSRFLKKS